MKHLSRVVWSDGMHLAAHHFQLQNRYFEDAIHFAVSSLWFSPYGFAACDLDEEAIRNGVVSVRHARGFFQDGLPFYFPGPDSSPDPKPIRELFVPTRDAHVVCLAIPATIRADETLATGEPLVRFVPDKRFVVDETRGDDERPIDICRKNLQLLLDIEITGDHAFLPMARVRRTGAGGFEYDSTFIPPLLSSAASPALLALLRRVVDLLEEKSNSIAEATRQPSETLADSYRRDLPGFLLRQTINSTLGTLRHQLLAKRGHPEEIYCLLAQLAGALCCFTLDAHPKDLPRYEHDDLTRCFGALEVKIRAWLELMLPTNCVTVALQLAAPWLWTAAIPPEHVARKSRWILEIRSAADEPTIISGAPRLVKVCSEKFAPELVKRALPGLTLTHLPVPPPAIPQQLDAQYFSIARSGPCWEHIVQTKTFGVYIPGDLPDPQLRLHILLEG